MKRRTLQLLLRGGLVLFILLLFVVDCLAAQVQRHFFFLSGWLLVICQIALLLLLRRRESLERVLQGAPPQMEVLLLVAGIGIVHTRHELPRGTFELLIYGLLWAVFLSGVYHCHARHSLLRAARAGDERGERGLEILGERLAVARLMHGAMVVAALPVTLAHGMLAHGHGALSHLMKEVLGP